MKEELKKLTPEQEKQLIHLYNCLLSDEEEFLNISTTLNRLMLCYIESIAEKGLPTNLQRHLEGLNGIMSLMTVHTSPIP